MAIIKKLYTSGRTADTDVNGNVSRRFAWAAVKQKILQRKTMWENMNGLNTNVKLHSSCSSTVFVGFFLGGLGGGLCAALFCKFIFFSAPDTWGSAQSSE